MSISKPDNVKGSRDAEDKANKQTKTGVCLSLKIHIPLRKIHRGPFGAHVVGLGS